jgi:Domain of unknown function (DUF4190)
MRQASTSEARVRTFRENGHVVVVPPPPTPPDAVVVAAAPSWRLPPPPPGSPPPPGPSPVVGFGRSGFAVASMVLGLVGFLAITAVLAVIFGHIALVRIRRSGGWQRGTGMALAGVILGWAYVALFALSVVVQATGA